MWVAAVYCSFQILNPFIMHAANRHTAIRTQLDVFIRTADFRKHVFHKAWNSVTRWRTLEFARTAIRWVAPLSSARNTFKFYKQCTTGNHRAQRCYHWAAAGDSFVSHRRRSQRCRRTGLLCTWDGKRRRFLVLSRPPVWSIYRCTRDSMLASRLKTSPAQNVRNVLSLQKLESKSTFLPNVPQFPKEHCFWKESQASSVCHSGKSKV